MTVETGTTIADFSRVDPPASDLMSESDNHHRLIKNILKDQFPGVGGEGFAEAITATEDDLNNTSASTSNFQAQIDANAAIIASLTDALFPVGTRLTFHQAACPAGWTQDTTVTNHMARIVGTAGGGVGGTTDPTDLSHSHTTADHTLTEAEIPAHDHYSGSSLESPTQDTYFGVVDGGDNLTESSNTDSTNSDTCAVTSPTGGGGAHNHGATDLGTIVPLHADFIICVKA